ncbi:hypothetical protein RAS1_18390 [Phycisphaerae bacterium RAS1]|nr:hypothetical protein RAS1_18390 [Phycisphaerae bacterium RAS1]
MTRFDARAILGSAVLLLCIPGCPPPPEGDGAPLTNDNGADPPATTTTVIDGPYAPSADATLKGELIADSIDIPEGVTISAGGDLTLRSKSSVVVAGKIVGRAAAQRGANVSIEADESVEIHGTVAAGNAPKVESASQQGSGGSGQDGGDGGAVSIKSKANVVIGRAARVTGGNGANGQLVNAIAEMSAEGEVSAKGGKGGKGGDVTISAASVLRFDPAGEANLVLGNGGQGGAADVVVPAEADGVTGTNVEGGRGGDSGAANLSAASLEGLSFDEISSTDGSTLLLLTGDSALILDGGIGGNGGNAGRDDDQDAAKPRAPRSRAYSKSRLTQQNAMPCWDPAGKEGFVDAKRGARGGDGAFRGGHGGFAIAEAGNGTGTGRGGRAFGFGGDGGNSSAKTAVKLAESEVFVLLGRSTFGGDGGAGKAFGGSGGPVGGSTAANTSADASGGKGGNCTVAIAPGQTLELFASGKGGDAFAKGGNGMNGASCCKPPPSAGQNGGDGGFAQARGGNGGDGVNARPGGIARAEGGKAGNGGDGEGPGDAGNPGGTSFAAGSRGMGTPTDEPDGTASDQFGGLGFGGQRCNARNGCRVAEVGTPASRIPANGYAVIPIEAPAGVGDFPLTPTDSNENGLVTLNYGPVTGSPRKAAVTPDEEPFFVDLSVFDLLSLSLHAITDTCLAGGELIVSSNAENPQPFVIRLENLEPRVADLTLIDLLAGDVEGSIYGIAEDGTAVGVSTDAQGRTRAIFWRDGGTTELPTLDAQRRAVAAAIDRDGIRIVGREGLIPKAVTWSGVNYATRTELPSLTAGQPSYATSTQGDYVAGASFVGSGATAAYRAVVWMGDDDPISIHPAGADASNANAVSSGGIVVGTARFGTALFGWVWTLEDGTQLISEILDDSAGLAYLNATAVNGSGEITTVAADSTGKQQFVILRPRP